MKSTGAFKISPICNVREVGAEIKEFFVAYQEILAKLPSRKDLQICTADKSGSL